MPSRLRAERHATSLTYDQSVGIPFADKISATIIGITGVIGTYLLGTKTVNNIVKGKE